MPYPHPIRLAGPWEYDARNSDGTLRHGRIKLEPAMCGDAAGVGGVVRWMRRFGCPTNVDAGERTWLVVESPCDGRVSLNDVPIGSVPAGEAWEAEVTARLGPRNVLTIEPQAAAVPWQGDSGMLPPRVRLEVRRLWYVSGLSATPGNRSGSSLVCISGTLAGEPSAPGELSLLIEGFDRELYFGPLAGNGPFAVEIPADLLPDIRSDSVSLAELNVQLLRGGEAVWQSQP